MIIKSAYLFAFLFALNFCAAQENWITLDKTDYSIMYPSNWENKDIEEYPGVELILFAGSNSSIKDGFAESINLVIEDISAYNISLEHYIEELLKELNNVYDIEISKNETVETNHYVLEYSIIYNDKIIKTKQHCWLKKEEVYALSFSTTAEEFVIYDEVSDTILRSFKLK